MKLLRHGVVNQVELEEYVCGVLAGEISPAWPLEALKAMAVLSRAFAANATINARNPWVGEIPCCLAARSPSEIVMASTSTMPLRKLVKKTPR